MLVMVMLIMRVRMDVTPVDVLMVVHVPFGDVKQDCGTQKFALPEC